MRKIKTFFNKDNHLNKGYAKNLLGIKESDYKHQEVKFKHILPPIDLISEYEYLKPGTLAKIINMAEQEQCHKHKIDQMNLKKMHSILKIGRICAFLSITFICLTTVFLTKQGYIAGALIFSCSAFFIIGVMFFYSCKKYFFKEK